VKTLTNKSVAFVIVVLCCLLVFLGIKNKSLSDELRLAKQDRLDIVKQDEELTNQVAQLNLKIKEQANATESNQELYAKLAAKLHEEMKIRQGLEEELEKLKQKK
jgi:cell shape-determining protein MreC